MYEPMYSQAQRFTAIILLFSLGLQSCTSNEKLNYSPGRKEIAKNPLKGGMQGAEEKQPDLSLHEAVAQGKLETVQLLLEGGPNAVLSL
jgi:hypothetical protein